MASFLKPRLTLENQSKENQSDHQRIQSKVYKINPYNSEIPVISWNKT